MSVPSGGPGDRAVRDNLTPDRRAPRTLPAFSCVLNSHGNAVRCVVVLPESGLVATACDDGHVRVFAPNGDADGDGGPLHDIKAHEGRLTGLAPLGGDVIASGGRHEGCISTWRASKGRRLETLKLPEDCGGVSVIAALGSECFVAGTLSGDVVFVSHLQGRKLEVLSVEAGLCGIISDISVCGDVIIAAASDCEAMVLSAKSHKCLTELSGHWDWVKCVSVSKTYFATGSDDKTIRLFRNSESYRLVHLLDGFHDDKLAFVTIIDDKLLMSASHNKAGGSIVNFTAVPSCNPVASLNVDIERISAIAITADGKLACVGQGGQLALLATPPESVKDTLRKHAAAASTPPLLPVEIFEDASQAFVKTPSNKKGNEIAGGKSAAPTIKSKSKWQMAPLISKKWMCFVP